MDGLLSEEQEYDENCSNFEGGTKALNSSELALVLMENDYGHSQSATQNWLLCTSCIRIPSQPN